MTEVVGAGAVVFFPATPPSEHAPCLYVNLTGELIFRDRGHTERVLIGHGGVSDLIARSETASVAATKLDEISQRLESESKERFDRAVQILKDGSRRREAPIREAKPAGPSGDRTRCCGDILAYCRCQQARFDASVLFNRPEMMPF